MSNRSPQNSQPGQKAPSQQQNRQDTAGQQQKSQPQQNLSGKDKAQGNPGDTNDAFPGSPSKVYAGNEKNGNIETTPVGRTEQGGRENRQEQNKVQNAPGRSPGDDEEE